MQVRGLWGQQSRAGNCIALVLNLGFTSSSPTLPSAARPPGCWVRSPPALSKATFPLGQLITVLWQAPEAPVMPSAFLGWTSS